MKRLFRGLAIVGLAGGLALVIYLGFAGGDKVPPEIAAQTNPVPRSDAVMAAARSTHAASCRRCHGEKGKGDGEAAALQSEPPPDLTDGRILGRMGDGEIYWIITRGRKPVMPPFESKLSREERWGLVHLMREFSSAGPGQH